MHATSGVAGGYRLGAGAALPPLLLDDDEVVAVAVGLRTAAGGSVAGIQETSVRALAKLEQVLPSRLRYRVNALWTSTVPVPGDGPTVDAKVLTAIAGACRDHQRLRFDYRDRNDWRTFRVDRLQPRTPTGPRFTPRDLPDDDVAAHVTRGVWSAGWRYRARVRLHAPAETLAERIPPAVGLLQAVDARTCVLDTGADTLDTLAVYLSMLGVDFEVGEPPDLVEHIRKLADRYSRATR